MEPSEGFVKVDGTPLFYRAEGAGPGLLFIHAANLDSSMWDSTAGELCGRYRVMRYDMRGMGRSGVGPEPYTVAGDIDAVLGTLAVDRCSIVGISAGGYCAIEYALARPKRVESLVLVSAGLFDVKAPQSASYDRDSAELAAAIASGDVEAMAEAYASMWLDGPGQSPTRIDSETRLRFKEMATASFRRRAAYRLPEASSPPPGQRLSEIECPTLIVAGSLDYDASGFYARLFESTIPRARRVTFAESGHLPPLDRPNEFNSVLAEFFDGVYLQG